MPSFYIHLNTAVFTACCPKTAFATCSFQPHTTPNNHKQSHTHAHATSQAEATTLVTHMAHNVLPS